MQQHRHQEFIRFLNAVEAAVSAGKLHRCHRGQLCHPQASRGPRVAGAPSALDVPFYAHLRLLAQCRRRLLRQLARRRLKRSVFRSIVELQAAIGRFLTETNADPRRFGWTKDPDKIIAAVKRGAPSVRFYPRACLPALINFLSDGLR